MFSLNELKRVSDAHREPDRHVAPFGKDPLVLLMLVDIVSYLINIVVILVIVQFVLSLLISFNVVRVNST